jgi:hypothetical protein
MELVVRDSSVGIATGCGMETEIGEVGWLSRYSDWLWDGSDGIATDCGMETEIGELGCLNRYSDWLRAGGATTAQSEKRLATSGRQRDRSSSPGRVKHFLLSMMPRLFPGPTQPPIEWISGALFSVVKTTET